MYASSASNLVWHNYGFTDSQLTDTWLQLVSISFTDSMHVSFLVGHAPW